MTVPSTPAAHCESCGMPLTSAADHALGDLAIPYCTHCTRADGTLQPRDERLERMTQWSVREDGLDYAAAREKAIAYMRSMPAWKDAF